MIGASGFLGSRLLANAPRDVTLVGTGHRRPVRPGNWRDVILDLSSPSALAAVVERERPAAVFFCSYDKSDRSITVDAARQAARLSARHGARFVFFSTDLVFDGARGSYTEDATVAPLMPTGTRFER